MCSNGMSNFPKNVGSFFESLTREAFIFGNTSARDQESSVVGDWEVWRV